MGRDIIDVALNVKCAQYIWQVYSTGASIHFKYYKLQYQQFHLKNEHLQLNAQAIKGACPSCLW